jgi:hypothetical protein
MRTGTERTMLLSSVASAPCRAYYSETQFLTCNGKRRCRPEEDRNNRQPFHRHLMTRDFVFRKYHALPAICPFAHRGYTTGAVSISTRTENCLASSSTCPATVIRKIAVRGPIKLDFRRQYLQDKTLPHAAPDQRLPVPVNLHAISVISVSLNRKDKENLLLISRRTMQANLSSKKFLRGKRLSPLLSDFCS